jgi:hypothetical protein
MNNTDFNGLREKLEQFHQWPMLYMFKFILPSDNQKIALIESIFGEDSELKTMPSSNGKYISITVREVMLSPQAVIDVYEKASTIEGVIAL